MAKREMKDEAKKRMLQHLKKMMSDGMHSGMEEGMKKVTIMSDSEDGLERGIDKAKEIMEKRESMMDDEYEEMEDKNRMKKRESMMDYEGDEYEKMKDKNRMKKMRGDRYADGGYKTTQTSKSLGEGKAYYNDPKKRYLKELKDKRNAQK